jgi:hypothetical protein
MRSARHPDVHTGHFVRMKLQSGSHTPSMLYPYFIYALSLLQLWNCLSEKMSVFVFLPMPNRELLRLFDHHLYLLHKYMLLLCDGQKRAVSPPVL